MKAADIIEGGVYRAAVSERLVDVRVDRIVERYDSWSRTVRTRYEVTNLRTSRKIVFKSAAAVQARRLTELPRRALFASAAPGQQVESLSESTKEITMEQQTLTAAGRRWAERNALTSMVANIALQGYGSSWPVAHITAAIQVANEEGGKS